VIADLHETAPPPPPAAAAATATTAVAADSSVELTARQTDADVCAHTHTVPAIATEPDVAASSRRDNNIQT